MHSIANLLIRFATRIRLQSSKSLQIDRDRLDKTPNVAKYAVMTLLNSVNLELHFLSVNPIFQEGGQISADLGLGQKSEVLDSSHNVHFPKMDVLDWVRVFRFEK
jgi:hypothetical protein